MTAGPVALSHKDMGNLQIQNLADGSSAQHAATKGQVDTAETNAKSRANHTGTQTASTILDFDTQVRVSRLDQMAAPTGNISLNSRKITNLADPTTAQDAATMAYVDAALAGMTQGLVLKGTVRAVVASNVNIASPGATLDGLSASNNDIFLLTAQTTGSQNGPYVYNGPSAAMTRAVNWDSSAEAALGSFWIVREGTSADLLAILTNDTAITLGTTTPTFIVRGLSAGGVSGYTETNPTTSAGGSWTVSHNLGTRLVHVTVARVASPYDIVDVRVERTSTNAVTVKPDVALGAGDWEVLVTKGV